jgi:hypothetical protein
VKTSRKITVVIVLIRKKPLQNCRNSPQIRFLLVRNEGKKGKIKSFDEKKMIFYGNKTEKSVIGGTIEIEQGSYTGLFARSEGEGEFEVIMGVQGEQNDVEISNELY